VARRTLLVMATVAVMAAMLVAAAAPALARVEQAVDRSVNQTQVAVKEAESPAAYQAVEQAQNRNRVADRSPVQTRGPITGGDALFLLGTVALLIAGGVLVHRVIRWQSQRR
jgi:Rieske Fe-S protein